MNTLLNVIWLVLAGVWLALAYLVAGIVNLVFIITIPFSLQAFKLAGYALWPFGRVVVERPDRDPALSVVGNVIWFVFAGVWLVLFHVLTALALMVTIIGIPLGIANLKMAVLALAPFGKQVVPVEQVGSATVVARVG